MDKTTQEMFDTIDQVADGVYVCRKDNKVTLHDKNNDFETKPVVHIVKIGSIYIGSDYNRNTYGVQNIVAINGFIYFSEANKCLDFEGRYMMVPSYNNRILMIWELDKEDGLFTVYDTKPNDTKINLSISFGAEVIDCSSNLGEILDVQISDNKQSVEIWVKQNSERGAECVVLIPYDKGIVKVGEIQNEYNN